LNNRLHPLRVRTPIGKFGGSLASLSAADMRVVAAKAALERAGVEPQQSKKRSSANARQAGGGPNPARQISLRSGVPQEVPAYTVNKACASGIKSIALGFRRLPPAIWMRAGGPAPNRCRGSLIISRCALGYRLGNQELVDGMYRDGFFCPLAKMLMGETAETLAVQYKITRERARSVCARVAATRSDGAIQRSLRCGNRSRQDRRQEGNNRFLS